MEYNIVKILNFKVWGDFMKKLIITFILGISSLIYSQENIVYEVVPIRENVKDIKIVRVLDGDNTGLYGIVGSDNKPITKLNNIIISVQKNYIYLVDIDYKEGLMTFDGKWIADIGKYNYKDKFSNMYKKLNEKIERNMFGVYSKKNGQYKYGFINYSGELVVPIEYEDIKNFSEGLAGVKLGNKWGYIDEKGSVKVGFNFDEVENFQNGLALVKVGEDYFYIDQSGDKKFLKTLFIKVRDGIDDIGHHVGEAFEGKLRIKEKTN